MVIATGGCRRPLSAVTKLTETGDGAAIYGATCPSISAPARGARNLTWSYDRVGNRVASTDSGAATNRTSSRPGFIRRALASKCNIETTCVPEIRVKDVTPLVDDEVRQSLPVGSVFPGADGAN